jgi:putative PIN family toxin of toxin-antitoxin system
MKRKRMAGKRKVKRFVKDVNAFITIFINKTYWLLQYILQNRIEIFTDKLLIEELLRVLGYLSIKKYLPLERHIYVEFVKSISTVIKSDVHNVGSPDVDDDYLFDIALTAHARLIVTGEKELLNWNWSPVPAISLTAFKKYFR